MPKLLLRIKVPMSDEGSYVEKQGVKVIDLYEDCVKFSIDCLFSTDGKLDMEERVYETDQNWTFMKRDAISFVSINLDTEGYEGHFIRVGGINTWCSYTSKNHLEKLTLIKEIIQNYIAGSDLSSVDADTLIEYMDAGIIEMEV